MVAPSPCLKTGKTEKLEEFYSSATFLNRMASRKSNPRLRKLGPAFYRRPATDVAREMIGTILVRQIGEERFRARIVETEAYLGPEDLASHASKGRTKRTEVMFGPAGHAYVFF